MNGKNISLNSGSSDRQVRDTPSPAKRTFSHPRNNTGAGQARGSAHPSAFFEVGGPSSAQAATPEPHWLPAMRHRCCGSDPDGALARKSHTAQGKREGFMKKSKVYCKLYFASLRSSFLQDLLISMIFSQMYLLTLESLCAISVSSTVSCAILSYKHSGQGKETGRPRINGELEANLWRGEGRCDS